MKVIPAGMEAVQTDMVTHDTPYMDLSSHCVYAVRREVSPFFTDKIVHSDELPDS